MKASSEKKERRKGKSRFNFIDLLILVLAILLSFGFLVSSVFSPAQEEELLLYLYPTSADLSQMEASDLSFSEGQIVYGTDGKTFGRVAKEYKRGDDVLVVQVDAQINGSDRMLGDSRLYIGQTVNIRCGNARLYNLKVGDIGEVTEHDGK